MTEQLLDKSFNLLMQKSKEQGYLLFDDILKMSEDYELDVQDIDTLSSKILENGVILLEQKPVNKKIVKNNTENTEDFEDWSHNDYEPVFSEIIEKESKQEFFINYIRNIVPPQRREMQTLQYQLLEGNKFARKRVIEMYLRLAVKQALKFSKQFEQDLNEMISCSCEGLVLAVDAYKPDENGQFSAYASLWIMNVMKRNINTKSLLFYYPTHVLEKYIILFKNREKFNRNFHEKQIQDDSLERIAEFLEVDLENAKYITSAFNEIQSLDKILDNDTLEVEKEIEKIDFKKVDRYSFEDNMIYPIFMEHFHSVIKSVIDDIPFREEKILKYRFGFGESFFTPIQELTLDSIGRSMGVSRERIRQLELKSLKRLRHPIRAGLLRPYWESE